ncbi:hypothetical protein [Streptomyces evansiae]|uniref:hypothetical protein n=1 Tax=Streptomyces evansiae TaxID=3075535 RepID=UPI0037DA1370
MIEIRITSHPTGTELRLTVHEAPAPRHEARDGDDHPSTSLDEGAGRRFTPEEARRSFARALDAFERAGRTIVGPKDFTDWCDRTGLSRPWVSARLKDAALRGRLEATGIPGRWRLCPRREG